MMVLVRASLGQERGATPPSVALPMNDLESLVMDLFNSALEHTHLTAQLQPQPSAQPHTPSLNAGPQIMHGTQQGRPNTPPASGGNLLTGALEHPHSTAQPQPQQSAQPHTPSSSTALQALAKVWSQNMAKNIGM